MLNRPLDLMNGPQSLYLTKKFFSPLNEADPNQSPKVILTNQILNIIKLRLITTVAIEILSAQVSKGKVEIVENIVPAENIFAAVMPDKIILNEVAENAEVELKEEKEREEKIKNPDVALNEEKEREEKIKPDAEEDQFPEIEELDDFIPLDEELIEQQRKEQFDREVLALVNKYSNDIGLRANEEVAEEKIEEELETKFIERIKYTFSTGNILREYYNVIDEAVQDIFSGDGSYKEKCNELIEFLDLYGSDDKFSLPDHEDDYITDRIKVSILQRMSNTDIAIINLNNVPAIVLDKNTEAFSFTNEEMDFNFIVKDGKRIPLAIFIMDNLKNSNSTLKLDKLVDSPDKFRQLLVLLPAEMRVTALDKLFSLGHLQKIITTEPQKEFILNVIPRDMRFSLPAYFKTPLPGELKLDATLSDNFFKAVEIPTFAVDIPLPPTKNYKEFMKKNGAYTEEGKKYLVVIKGLIAELKEWGVKNKVNLEVKDGRFDESFERLCAKFAEPEWGILSEKSEPLFREGPELLKAVITLLNKESEISNQPLSKAEIDKRKKIFLNLLPGLRVCEEGIKTNLADAKLQLLGSQAALMKLRRDFATQVILEVFKKNRFTTSGDIGMEIHNANTVLNYYAYELGINKIEDSWSPPIANLKQRISSPKFMNNELETNMTLANLIEYFYAKEVPDATEIMSGLDNKNYQEKFLVFEQILGTLGEDEAFRMDHLLRGDKMAEGEFALESPEYIKQQIFNSIIARLINSDFVNVNKLNKKVINGIEVVLPTNNIQHAYIIKPGGFRESLFAYIDNAHEKDYEDNDSMENLKAILAALKTEIDNDPENFKNAWSYLSDDGKSNFIAVNADLKLFRFAFSPDVFLEFPTREISIFKFLGTKQKEEIKTFFMKLFNEDKEKAAKILGDWLVYAAAEKHTDSLAFLASLINENKLFDQLPESSKNKLIKILSTSGNINEFINDYNDFKKIFIDIDNDNAQLKKIIDTKNLGIGFVIQLLENSQPKRNSQEIAQEISEVGKAYFADVINSNKKVDIIRTEIFSRIPFKYKIHFFKNLIVGGYTTFSNSAEALNTLFYSDIRSIDKALRNIGNDNHLEKVKIIDEFLNTFGEDKNFNTDIFLKKFGDFDQYDSVIASSFTGLLFSTVLTRLINSNYEDISKFDIAQPDMQLIVPYSTYGLQHEKINAAFIKHRDGKLESLFSFIERAHELNSDNKDSLQDLKDILMGINNSKLDVSNKIINRIAMLSEHGRDNYFNCEEKFLYNYFNDANSLKSILDMSTVSIREKLKKSFVENINAGNQIGPEVNTIYDCMISAYKLNKDDNTILSFLTSLIKETNLFGKMASDQQIKFLQLIFGLKLENLEKFGIDNAAIKQAILEANLNQFKLFQLASKSEPLFNYLITDYKDFKAITKDLSTREEATNYIIKKIGINKMLDLFNTAAVGMSEEDKKNEISMLGAAYLSSDKGIDPKINQEAYDKMPAEFREVFFRSASGNFNDLYDKIPADLRGDFFSLATKSANNNVVNYICEAYVQNTNNEEITNFIKKIIQDNKLFNLKPEKLSELVTSFDTEALSFLGIDITDVKKVVLSDKNKFVVLAKISDSQLREMIADYNDFKQVIASSRDLELDKIFKKLGLDHITKILLQAAETQTKSEISIFLKWKDDHILHLIAQVFTIEDCIKAIKLADFIPEELHPLFFENLIMNSPFMQDSDDRYNKTKILKIIDSIENLEMKLKFVSAMYASKDALLKTNLSANFDFIAKLHNRQMSYDEQKLFEEIIKNDLESGGNLSQAFFYKYSRLNINDYAPTDQEIYLASTMIGIIHKYAPTSPLAYSLNKLDWMFKHDEHLQALNKLLKDFENKLNDQKMNLIQEASDAIKANNSHTQENKNTKINVISRITEAINNYRVNPGQYTLGNLISMVEMQSRELDSVSHVGFFNSIVGGKSKTNKIVSEFIKQANDLINVEHKPTRFRR